MDTIRFTRYARNPILKPEPLHSWDALNVFNAGAWLALVAASVSACIGVALPFTTAVMASAILPRIGFQNLSDSSF